MSHIFEACAPFRYNEKAKKVEPVPVLAEKWVRSEDGKLWTFYLRKGVKFHDGTPFDAAAVQFNIDRLCADKPRTLYGKGVKAAVDHAEVADEYTIKIYLKRPVAIFMNLFGRFTAAIVSPTSVKKYGDKVGRHPTGTGPFKFVKWVPGEYVELEVFKEYWGGRAPLDGIIFRFVPDSNARINMVQTGEVDLALNIPVQDHERLRKTGKIDIETWPTATLARLYMDTAAPPFDEVKVRQAVKLAIDTEGIARNIFQRNAVAVDSPISPFSWGYYAADPPIYDPEKAKKLLAEAGWIEGDKYREKEGKKLAVTIYSPLPGYQLMGGESLLAIQEYLRKVGFDVTVSFSDFSAFLAEFYKTRDERVQKAEETKRGDAYFIDWNSRSDAWFTLYTKMHSRVWYPDKKHTSFYRNTEFDKSVLEAEVELDQKRRFELYKKAQIIVSHDTPIVHMWAPKKTLAKRKYVHGLKFAPMPPSDAHLIARQAWME